MEELMGLEMSSNAIKCVSVMGLKYYEVVKLHTPLYSPR